MTNTNPPGSLEAPLSTIPADAGGAVSVAVPPAGGCRLSRVQRELARHALGLPNRMTISYRNRYFAGPGHAAYGDWCAMEEMGAAQRVKEMQMRVGAQKSAHFEMTLAGAEAALNKGECLDPEDFPVVRLLKEGK